MAQLVKNLNEVWRPRFDPWVGKIPWRRERLPTPVFWPGEFHGLYSPWDRKELDTTERLSLSLFSHYAGKNINNLRYADDTTLKAESEEELRSLLMMANRWGNTENSDRIYFLGLQNHCKW